MIFNVLMVCEGNLCRSPMAAALLEQRGTGLRVSSAGLAAVVGQPAAQQAIAALAEVGIDLRSHRATQLTRQLANEAELILTMTAAQTRSLESLYPPMRGRIFTLRGFDGADIDDPVGMPLSDFRLCRAVLTSAIDYWVKRLGQLNGSPREHTHACDKSPCMGGGAQ